MIYFDGKFLSQQVVPPSCDCLCDGIEFAHICGRFGHPRRELFTEKCQRMALLGEDYANSLYACISLNFERSGEIRKGENGSGCECLLERLEC